MRLTNASQKSPCGALLPFTGSHPCQTARSGALTLLLHCSIHRTHTLPQCVTHELHKISTSPWSTGSNMMQTSWCENVQVRLGMKAVLQTAHAKMSTVGGKE